MKPFDCKQGTWNSLKRACDCVDGAHHDETDACVCDDGKRWDGKACVTREPVEHYDLKDDPMAQAAIGLSSAIILLGLIGTGILWYQIHKLRRRRVAVMPM
jgi:hypothetical protein